MIKLTKINTSVNEWSEARYTKNIRNNTKKNCTEVINYILENDIAPDSVFYSKLSDGNYSVLVQHIKDESEVEQIRQNVLEYFKDSGIIIKSSILKPSIYGEPVFTVKFIVKSYDVTTDASVSTDSSVNRNTDSKSPSRKRVSNIFDHLDTSEVVSQFVNEHKASEFTWNPPDYITVAGIKFHITNGRDTDVVRKPNGTSAVKYSTYYESTEKDSKGKYPIFTVVVVQRRTWGFGNNHSATYAYNTWEMEQKLKSFINERIEDDNMIKLLEQNDPIVESPLSIHDKNFKEAVRFCDGTLEDLADELWRRYVDLDDAIDAVKLYYQNGRGRRSLLADIKLHFDMNDFEDVIEQVYFDKDNEMNSVKPQFGRV